LQAKLDEDSENVKTDCAMNTEQLKETLRLHALWLKNEPEGKRADLSGADLRWADLSGANLSGAYLRWAYLSGANLSGADLRWADLSGANLSGADLSGANLSGANLSGAYLSGANLSGAYLRWADLSGADLSGADLSGADLKNTKTDLEIPVVENLDTQIFQAVEANSNALNMRDWHSCETTHCRAGWHVHLAGKPGYDLEAKVGPNVAGALIYAKSTGRQVPDFYANNDQALADIKRCAELAKEGK
jgi:hypothetical protein